MNLDSIILCLSPFRISIIELPEEFESELSEFLKAKATYVVEEEIKDRKTFFKYLHDYAKTDDLLILFNNDHIINKRSNSQYSSLLRHISNYDFGSAVPFELENGIWDFDYDKYKISGFNEYNGRIMFITKLNKDQIIETLVSRHCFLDSQMISKLGNS